DDRRRDDRQLNTRRHDRLNTRELRRIEDSGDPGKEAVDQEDLHDDAAGIDARERGRFTVATDGIYGASSRAVAHPDRRKDRQDDHEPDRRRDAKRTLLRQSKTGWQVVNRL